MKKILLTLTSVLFFAITFAQNVPQGINYQALARDASGTILTNHYMTLKASIYSDTVTNTMQWQELHTITTNDVGIFSIVLGTGFAGVGSVQTSFTNIDWNTSTHYIKIELDHGSGFMDYGITALQSVPYSLAAETADEANAVDWTNINNIPADIADGDDGDDGFANDSNVISNANGDYANDDFVFGSSTLDWNNTNDHINRMFFDKSKGAFRAGGGNPLFSQNENWDVDSIGEYSFATGYKTKAKGEASTAMGFMSEALGNSSTAMGYYTDATGAYSTAMGFRTKASGYNSTAMGSYTEATGNYSTAMGEKTEASGYASTAIGSYTDATGAYSTAMGSYTKATGNYSTAMGGGVIATGAGELYNSGNVKGLSFVSTSDRRVKQNITPFSGALSKVMLLSPKTYFYNTAEFPRFEAEKDKPQIGFIAQEVEAIFPEMVTTDGDEVGLKGVRYGQLTTVLVQAIKEQQEMIQELQKEVKDLKEAVK